MLDWCILHRDPSRAPHPRKQASLRHKARASSRTREALRHHHASRVREALLPLWGSQLCWRRTPPPQRSIPTTKSPRYPRSTPSAPPREASFPPPQSESKLSHSRSPAVPSRFWTAEALLPLWQSQLCWRRAPPPQRWSPTTRSSPFPRSTPSTLGSLPGAARVYLIADREAGAPMLGFLPEFLAAFCGGADGLDEGVAEAFCFESFEPGDGGAAGTGDFVAENGGMTLGL